MKAPAVRADGKCFRLFARFIEEDYFRAIPRPLAGIESFPRRPA